MRAYEKLSMEGSSKACCTRELSAEQKFTKFPQYARRRFKSFCSRVTVILCTSGCFLHVCGQRKLIAYHNKLINICMFAYIVYANTYFWYADSSRVRFTQLSSHLHYACPTGQCSYLECPRSLGFTADSLTTNNTYIKFCCWCIVDWPHNYPARKRI